MKTKDGKHHAPFEGLNLKTADKVLLAALGAIHFGKDPVVEVSLAPNQATAAAKMLLAVREFEDALSRPTASVREVSDKLAAKHGAAAEFEKSMGFPWPL